MARQEKMLDPSAGPLQAFAFALRKVRTEAGNPTYRTLAKLAGYSAATLSEAASGIRRPTLDVVLAYVGACHGDVDLWRERWHELHAELAGADAAAGVASPPAVAAAVAPTRQEPDLKPEQGPAPQIIEIDRAPVTPPPASLLGRGLWRRWKPVSLAGAAAVLLIGTVGAFAVEEQGRSGCPAKLSHAAFTALTYGTGARVHDGAARDAPITATIPAGCTVGFVGYCLGEKIHDDTGGSPDIRWFKLPDGDVITSGIVHGNPPPGLAPVGCTDSQPGPSAIALNVAVDRSVPGTLKLTATGTHLTIVGFAALFQPDTDQPAERRWRQVGFTEETADSPGFSVPWKLDRVAAGADGDSVLIVATACLGGDGPTEIMDARSADPDKLGPAFPPASLTAEQREQAATAACSYPA